MKRQGKNKIATRGEQTTKSKMYHLAVFLGAAAVLAAGGMWRGGGNEAAGQDPGITALEMLRLEVSGLQSVLKRSELQSINDVMTQITTKTAGSVVSVKPLVSEPMRHISSHGGPAPGLYELPPPPELAPGISGLIINQEGYVVTSAGVVRFDPPFQIVRDGSTYTADLKSVDRDSYLAVLKIREVASGSAVLAPISVRELAPGEWVIRHGRSPSGKQSRSIAVLESVSTTSSGRTVGMLDSEGPAEMDGATLMNESGEIIGIYVKPPGAPGMVVPIKATLEIASMLMSESSGPQSWAGFELQDLSGDLRDYFAVQNGVLVTKVEAGSPASKAGIRPLDLIGTINGQNISSAEEVTSLITNGRPGTQLDLGIQRDSSSQTILLVTEQAAPVTRELGISSADPTLLLKLTQAEAGVDGLVVTEIGPRPLANRLGLQAGDVVISINRTRLRTVNQFSGIQRRFSNEGGQLWEIRRAEQVFFVAVKGRADLL